MSQKYVPPHRRSDSASQNRDSYSQRSGPPPQRPGPSFGNHGAGPRNYDSGSRNYCPESGNYGSLPQKYVPPHQRSDPPHQRSDPTSQNCDSSSQRPDPSFGNLSSVSQSSGKPSKRSDPSLQSSGPPPKKFGPSSKSGSKRKLPETKEEAEARKKIEKSKEIQKSIDAQKFNNKRLEVRRPFRGTVGSPVALLTNCYRLCVEGQTFFVYDVLISGKQDNKQQYLDYQKRRDIFWQFVSENFQNFNIDQYCILFDDDRTVFTKSPILDLYKPNRSKSFKFKYNGTYGKFNIELKIRCKFFVRVGNLNGLQVGNNFTPLLQYVTQTAMSQFWRMPEYWLAAEHQKFPDNSIWTANGNCLIQTQLLFGQQPLEENFFSKLYGTQTTQEMKMSVHRLDPTILPPEIMGNLFKMYRGLVSGVHLGENGQAFVNFGLKHQICANFDLPLIQYCSFICNGEELSADNLIELSKLQITMNQKQKTQFNEECAGLYLKTICEPILRFNFVKLTGKSVSGLLARPNPRVKVYNPGHIELLFPHLPLVKVKNFPKLIPIELLKVSDTKNKVVDLRDRILRKLICQATAIDPQTYRDKISSMANQALLDYNPQMDAFRVSVRDRSSNGDLKPIEVNGRILPIPYCQYTEDENPLEKEVLEAALPVTLIACAVKPIEYAKKDEFVQQLAVIAHEMGVSFENREHVICPFEEFKCLEDVQRYVQKYATKYRTADVDLHGHRILFLFIMGGLKKEVNPGDVTTAKLYSWIKHAGDNLVGVPTQCVNARTLEDVSTGENKLEPMIRSIVAKINTRLGGVMNEIQSGAKSQCNEVFSRYTKEDSPSLFVGIFVTNPRNCKKHVISVSFNIDRKGTRFAHIGVLAQKEIYSFNEFTTIFLRVLTTFKEKVGRLPANVFIFRGALSEGVKDWVTKFELERFFEAWLKFEAMNKIRVRYFVVDRAHNFRFFLKDGSTTNGDLNMPRGTVVDSGIVAPNYSKPLMLDTVKGVQGFSENQFILCSHQTKPERTARPSSYIMTWYNNENAEPDPDDIQLLIFSLCFLVQRSVPSVATPAPLHYARLKAGRMSDYLLATSVESDLETHSNLQLTNYVT